jgi:acetyltransferase-like isoleucine patch superfamily enzyme
VLSLDDQLQSEKVLRIKMKTGVPFILAEPIAAIAGLFGVALGKEKSGSSARARGWLTCPALRDQRLSIGQRVEFVGKRNIQLADKVSLLGNSYLNASGGFIKIGSNTHIDQFCVLYGQGGLTIGSDCAIASGVIMYTQTNQYAHDESCKIVDQPVVYKTVTIGQDVWIGAAAVILPGVEIGDHAVVGAGALVRQDVPPWSIVGGIPAKILGHRNAANRSDAAR